MNKQKTTKQKNKISGIIKFWLIVLVLYFLAFLVQPETAWRGIILTGQTLLKIVPIFGLIFGMMILVNLFLTPERIKRHFGYGAGWQGWFYAIIFGILVGGPPYALYPMLKQMKKHGLKISYLVAFLYNRNVKISLIPAMIYYFGWQYTIVITILILVFSVLSGLIMEKVLIKK